MPSINSLHNLIEKYFPDDPLFESKLPELDKAFSAYIKWNEKVNVISRKDIENLAERHFLHSLSIMKVIRFIPGTQVADIGTGGGFPGIPLAIMFPEVSFLLVDSITKKIEVVQKIVQEAGLDNVQVSIQRVEDGLPKQDFILGRAVKNLPRFCKWVKGTTYNESKNSLENGILYLTGMDAEGIGGKEDSLTHPQSIFPLGDYFEELFFSTKILVHIPKC